MRALLLAAPLVVLAPVAAVAGEYVLTAPNWGAKQSAAVAAAGGSVVFAHDKAGLAVVTSDSSDFLARAMASNAFQGGALDQVVQWQTPAPVQEVSAEAITPGDESRYGIQWHLPAVEAPAAWAAGCTGKGARVAILDGGIYNIHPDIQPNLDKACSVSFVPGRAYNTDTGTFWHGTHVAGIVAGADNGFGGLGVAPEATLLGVKVLHGGSGSFGGVIGGILYASDPASFGAANCARADIINMSLGAVFAKSETGGGSLVAALNKAVNFAASRGVLVVSAAGNDGIDFGQAFDYVNVPGDSGSGLAVTATGPVGFALGATNFRRPASYSSYGEGYVAVAGPGGDAALPGSAVCTVAGVTQFCWVFDLVFSDCRGGAAPPSFSMCWAAGTSMATPAAAGVAALIVQAHPGISLGALKAKLLQTADDEGKVGHDEFYGSGFVNARRACSE